MSNCLCCQQGVPGGASYHPRCLKDLFDRARVPAIPFGIAEVPSQVIQTGARMSISGVQMKLSVRLNPDTWKMETVAEGGTHILKPEPGLYEELPQNENVCMNMAAELKLPTPPHGLFPMADGKLCYLIKRFDRLEDGLKLPKETMFQILNAEDKYRGSLEQVAKAIRTFATRVGLDGVDFLERVLLCFLIGNGDMHLKNWALLTHRDGSVSLAPCYDLVSSGIYIPDEEDSALTLNGKRNKLSRQDFEAFAAYLPIAPRAAANIFQKFRLAKERLFSLCETSQLSPPLRQKLRLLMDARYQRLFNS